MCPTSGILLLSLKENENTSLHVWSLPGEVNAFFFILPKILRWTLYTVKLNLWKQLYSTPLPGPLCDWEAQAVTGRTAGTFLPTLPLLQPLDPEDLLL